MRDLDVRKTTYIQFYIKGAVKTVPGEGGNFVCGWESVKLLKNVEEISKEQYNIETRLLFNVGRLSEKDFHTRDVLQSSNWLIDWCFEVTVFSPVLVYFMKKNSSIFLKDFKNVLVDIDAIRSKSKSDTSDVNTWALIGVCGQPSWK